MPERLAPLDRSPLLRRLGELATEGRLSHSLLFTGPEGSGKEAAAFELARVLQCGDDRACTHKLLGLRHPDVHFSFPAEASLSGADYRQILDAKAIEPLARIHQPSSAIIPIGDPDKPHPCSVRQIRRFVAAVPFEAPRRIAIVADAHRMNRQAANALLKTLEEPPPAALLILCTHQPHLLPATVRSRCARFRIPALGETELADHLVAAHGQDAAVAAQAVAVAGGNARAALDLVDPESQAVAAWSASLLGWLLADDRPALLKGAERVAKGQDPTGAKGGVKITDASLSASRDVGVRSLDFLVADLLGLARLAEGAQLSPARSAQLKPLLSALGDQDASSMAQLLMAARADLMRNVNVSLVLTHAFLAARGVAARSSAAARGAAVPSSAAAGGRG